MSVDFRNVGSTLSIKCADVIARRANPLMPTLKLHSNGLLHSNMVVGTLTVDGWAVTFGTARRGLGGLRSRLVPASLYQMLQPIHQRPVYQLHIIWCGTITASGLLRAKRQYGEVRDLWTLQTAVQLYRKRCTMRPKLKVTIVKYKSNVRVSYNMLSATCSDG